MHIISTQLPVWILTAIMGVFVFFTPAKAVDKDRLSNELTTLYRSARAVISDKQKHINDASIGNKGLTASEVIKRTHANFKKATGAALDMETGQEAKQAMLTSVGTVMDEAQELINEKAKGSKVFYPRFLRDKSQASLM
ncbi:MAG: hypothetical protein COB30_004130 [Ectothiorhodospiraceae bacterium]|nr:hypothetical protein [Ectothiorhodospiraceae bacterium]